MGLFLRLIYATALSHHSNFDGFLPYFLRKRMSEEGSLTGRKEVNAVITAALGGPPQTVKWRDLFACGVSSKKKGKAKLEKK